MVCCILKALLTECYQPPGAAIHDQASTNRGGAASALLDELDVGSDMNPPKINRLPRRINTLTHEDGSGALSKPLKPDDNRHHLDVLLQSILAHFTSNGWLL